MSLYRRGSLFLLNPVTNTPLANYELTAGPPILDIEIGYFHARELLVESH